LTPFLESIFSPQNIKAKDFKGQTVSCKQMIGLFQNCVASFNETDFNPAPTINYLNRFTLQKVVQQALDYFSKESKTFKDSTSTRKELSETEIENTMEKFKSESLDL